MERIKGIYNGYKLENGKVYRLVEHGNNNYEMAEVTSYNEEKPFIHETRLTGVFFTRVKDFKEYLKAM